MTTRYCGHRTGFNPTGDNDTDPNPFGPPATKFGGRSALPAGSLQHYPGPVADVSNRGRRLAKAEYGDGGGGGTVFRGRDAFATKGTGRGTGRKPGGMAGGKNMEMNRK